MIDLFLIIKLLEITNWILSSAAMMRCSMSFQARIMDKYIYFTLFLIIFFIMFVMINLSNLTPLRSKYRAIAIHRKSESDFWFPEQDFIQSKILRNSDDLAETQYKQTMVTVWKEEQIIPNARTKFAKL